MPKCLEMNIDEIRGRSMGEEARKPLTRTGTGPRQRSTSVPGTYFAGSGSMKAGHRLAVTLTSVDSPARSFADML